LEQYNYLETIGTGPNDIRLDHDYLPLDTANAEEAITMTQGNEYGHENLEAAKSDFIVDAEKRNHTQ